MPLLDLDQVIAVHDEIIERLGGIVGFANGGRGGVEGALKRIEMHQLYGHMVDVFSIAALYAAALARGHVFNDGN
ncbi:Fic family protein [Achromobacter sp. MFA1 R4]|uniref:Fic family protein n=1 Tax=Achromobacter sp. MFA1 R4 TaxID=1881016 RepID=UPI001E304F42|nr:Fic family protein [Achromobacter sp. MFA1 R4]